MTTRSLRSPVLGALVLGALALAGCNKEKSLSGTACKDGSLPPERVVAKWNGGQVTAGEAEKANKGKIDDLYQKLYQTRSQGVEELAIEKILDAEAKKKGVTREALLKSEVEDKAGGAPSDEEVQKLFDQAQASGQLPPGSKLEDVKPQIVQFLQQKGGQEKTRAYIDGLRKQYDLKVDFPEPPKEKVQVAATGPARGPDNAKITLIEFSDFQCPYCGKAHDTVEEVMQAYAGKVKLVYRQFPLSFHENAEKAAEASLCANDQKKFWEMYDVLFKNQGALKVDDLKGYAKQLGLDEKKFADCLDSGGKKAAVEADQKAGSDVGVTGTPAFFINGYPLSGAQPIEEFKKIIHAELAAK